MTMQLWATTALLDKTMLDQPFNFTGTATGLRVVGQQVDFGRLFHKI